MSAVIWLFRAALILILCWVVIGIVNETGRTRYVVRQQVNPSAGRYEFDMYCRIEGRFKQVDRYLGHYVAVGAEDVPDRVEWSAC